MRYYEDFHVGDEITLAPHHFSIEEIIEFAEQFDPQAFHLDADSDEAKALGGLIASGWHTCSVFMRMMCDAYLLDSASQGSAGLDEVRWLKPVYAGDTLSGKATVKSRRRLKSRPTIGLVDFHYALFNQNDEQVLRVNGGGMISVRNPSSLEQEVSSNDE